MTLTCLLIGHKKHIQGEDLWCLRCDDVIEEKYNDGV